MPLVLERKVGEAILIGETIRVTVVKFRGKGKVKLMIEAPKDVNISRDPS